MALPFGLERLTAVFVQAQQFAVPEKRDEFSPLLNHLISAGEECRWNREAKRFGGCEVHHQIELG